jgi:hypothetical protein
VGAALGLEWIEAQAAALAPPETSALAAGAAAARPAALPQLSVPSALPPRIELEAAAELARDGDLERLRDWCEELATGAPEHAAFVAEVRRRADCEAAPALADWLEARVAEGV